MPGTPQSSQRNTDPAPASLSLRARLARRILELEPSCSTAHIARSSDGPVKSHPMAAFQRSEKEKRWSCDPHAHGSRIRLLLQPRLVLHLGRERALDEAHHFGPTPHRHGGRAKLEARGRKAHLELKGLRRQARVDPSAQPI